jgi:hypothetical protein
MTTIVDEFTNGMSADTARANMRAVVEAYGYDGSGNAGDVRAFANTLLVPAGRSIGAAELGGGLRDDWNLLRDPAALNFAIAKAADPTALVLDAEYMRTGDFASAAPDWGVGAENIYNADGVLVASQATEAHRVRAARRPVTGVRNFAIGSAVPTNTTHWPADALSNGIQRTKLSTGQRENSNAFARYRIHGVASANAFMDLFVVNSGLPATSGNWVASTIVTLISGGTYGANAATGVRCDIAEGDPFVATAGAYANKAQFTPQTLVTTREIATGKNPRILVTCRVNNGDAVDFEVEIEAPALEQGTTRGAWQATTSLFNITEAGVRSVTEFDFDGVSDRMTLASSFAPSGDFGAFIAHNATGILAGGGGLEFRHAALRADGSGNQTEFAGVTAGNQLLAVNSIGAGAAVAWRNGVSLTPTLTGSMRPVAGPITTFGGDGASAFLTGRVAVANLFNTPISDATRTALQIVNAARIGVTLP